MLFNSLAFLLFFPIVALLYWVMPWRWRNTMLLAASYYFYMNWRPEYALLILLSTLTTWFCGNQIASSATHKQRWLTVCLTINLAILFTFKYLGFAARSITAALHALGVGMTVPELDILLPVGISFYTFQALGYTIDVYRGSIKPEKSLATYALFVAFFPQLVAGPIERARNLLPQFHSKHDFDASNFIEGFKLMVWGYFMKLCVAENVSSYVDAVYNNLPQHNGTSVWLATFFFTMQIFCDFGGYSLIAIGTARCLGFTLMQNFNHPYLARSVKEFWRRWHISLSSWFGEYVYIPLGGSRCSEGKHQRNLMVTMLVSGLWHGANWTFVVWGGVHGMLLCLHSLKNKYLNFKIGDGRIGNVLSIVVTFVIVMLCWVFFRANSISDAMLAFNKMFTERGMLFNGEGRPSLIMGVFLIFLLFLKEVKDECQKVVKDESQWHRFDLMHNRKQWVQMLGTTMVIVIILLCGNFNGGQFIYFQF